MDEVCEVSYGFEVDHEIDLSLEVDWQDVLGRGLKLATPSVRTVVESGIGL
jgi:hypothetical protein